jgi:CRP-like cAMP-binding protein
MITVSAWARRLGNLASLTHEEMHLLEQLAASSRHFATHDAIAKAGDPADRMLVVLDGLACEYKLLPDGRRQILAYLFPGDMTDPRQLLLTRWDHSLCVLWPARIATLMPDAVQRLERHPNIFRAVTRYAVMKQAIAREWLVNVGNRTAFERTSHLLCETYSRLKSVGLTSDHAFELPLTQAELADTLALSAVHVNRTLMELRRLKMVTFQNRHAAIHDYGGLRAAAGFDPTYLQVPAEAHTY